jgi:hypothetical protein
MLREKRREGVQVPAVGGKGVRRNVALLLEMREKFGDIRMQ